MKKLAMILAFSLMGAFAHAETTELDTYGNDAHAMGAWVCGMTFKGTAKGLKVIIGHFKTVAYGTLVCKGVGKKYYQDVKLTIGHHWIGPSAGIGYFKMAGAASEISLLNKSPEVILGKYKIATADASIIAGVGTFTGVKVGLPQLAVNFSVKLLKGLGLNVGIDKLTITAVSDPEVVPE
ncbi:hypothetical protein QJS83_05380 [Bdellovibrio sp. 22V]|uniref:hypothetical protein n=1 Tax=Bdellovibrio TaxID=958 RepID=UPI0025431DD3|nr:hypothetical protein [Bdellovibrio sp. 22V]WII73300.1 hypothetical protein QJS83_05380 [Bdellovibrio sp. 22V]